jgi:DNA-binding transcriptional ArsR family regulator
VDNFTKKLEELGPLGGIEEICENDRRVRLEAVLKLVPYIKLVVTERLRVPENSEKAYREFYASEEFDRLFDELIRNKLAISMILTLLGEKPLSTGEMSEALGLSPSEVSRHMNSSSRQGLVRYDTEQKRYALA